MKHNKTKTLTLTAMMIPVIAVCSQLTLPFSAVPMTLQTFAICLTGSLLGPYRGLSAATVYLLMGAVGVPVFAGFQGSLAVIFGPTGGFLIGFLPLAFFSGLSRGIGGLRSALLFALGLLLCHLLGVLRFSCVSGNSLSASLLLSSLPYLPKDILSCVGADLLAKKLRRHLKTT